MVWTRTLLFLATGIFLAGATLGLLGRPSRTWAMRGGLACALLASGLTACIGVLYWQRPMEASELLFSLDPPVSDVFQALVLDLFIDRLASFFLLLSGGLSSAVALYSFVWLADKAKRHLIAGVYNIFVLSALWLVVVNNVFFFLVWMEVMTLSFSYLTLYKHDLLLEDVRSGNLVDDEEKEAATRAFKVYLIFAHAGAMLVTAALILLALSATNVSFDALRSLSLVDSPGLASTIFVLALVGLGIKGGVAPFHPWVSIVHPYSPTTTHALTLGLIIKVSSFYLLMRIAFEFLQPAVWWWGWLTLVLAGVTALVGVFLAITNRDLKTALSNHSIENIGIILAGIGLALLLSSAGSTPILADLALIAALYHLLNHTVFKGLLYLCTGTIELRMGTVRLEALGGLVSRLPWTAIAFLIGAVSIAGFPPFNGFISEWLTLQALFASQDILAEVQPWMAVGLFAALLMLGTAFGLTALAFVKIAGEAILGAPRSREASGDHRENTGGKWPVRAVLAIMAILCLLLGLFPGWVANQLGLLAAGLLPLGQPAVLGTTPTSLVLAVPTSEGNYVAHLSMVPVLLLIALPFSLGLLLTLTRTRLPRGPVWNCGTPYRPETMQISGGAFGFMIWSWLSGRHAAGTPLWKDRIPYRLPVSATRHVRDGFRRVMNAAVGLLLGVSQRFGDWFQDGDIRRYLAYLFVAFVVLMILAVLAGGR